MRIILQEIKFALRQLRKSPTFTFVTVLTLALGIGANTAVFTLFDQVLLRNLPVSHPDQLVRLRWTGDAPGHFNSYGGDDRDYFSYPMYRDLRDKNDVFIGTIANDQQGASVEWNNKPDMADCELVSGNYFQELGLQPAAGRLILPSDEAVNTNPVAVLSFNAWKTQFGSDPHVVGQTLLVNAQPFTIAGVAPPNFHSIVAGATPAIFVPLTAKNLITPRWQDLDDRRSNWLTVAARLKPGVSSRQAEVGLAPLWHALRAEEFKDFKHQDRWRKEFLDESHLVVLNSARGFSPLRDEIGLPLKVLMAMVGLLVLMACINISSLLLVRAAGRAREISVRYAMGAGRWQIVRQLLLEGLLLGAIGGGLGLLLAPAVSRMLIRRIAGDSATDLPLSSSPDLRILLFAFALSIIVSLGFSLAPSFRFLRPDVMDSLKQQSSTGTGGQLRFRRLSVALQISLSLLLLMAAGLFIRTLKNLRSTDVGFTTAHLIGFEINPRLAGYEPQQTFELYKRVADTLAALPGSRAVGATDDPDLVGGDTGGNVTIAGYTVRPDEDLHVEMPSVTPGYFSALEIPLLAGRTFTDQDSVGKPNVAVVNEAFARRYFGGARDAIGHFLGFVGAEGKADTEIVGVVRDTKHRLRDEPRPTVYRSRFQLPEPSSLYFYLRTWQPADLAVTSVRSAMHQMDSKLALGNLRSVDDQIIENLSTERMVTLLSVSFGVLAMLLAGVGLYGVLAYATTQRTREIGIRMALGAQRSSVIRLVLMDVLWLAGITIAVTIPLALLLARMLRSQLYGVKPGDPLTIFLGTVLVVAVVLLSALLPARRAASTNPIQALRSE